MASGVETNQSFYIWPAMGKKLSLQWDDVRANWRALAPIVKGTEYDIHPDGLEKSSVQSRQYGTDDKHNRFRIYYDPDGKQLKIQFNSNTEANPCWNDAFIINENDGALETVADRFYLFINVKETDPSSRIYSANTILFNSSDFYITPTTGQLGDLGGNPVVNLVSAAGSGGVSDHGLLTGLTPDDDHPQYILVDGSRPFTGDQSIGGFKLTNVGEPVAGTDAARLQDLPTGFYLNVKQTDGLAAFKGINTINFEADSFYLTQNSPNTDEVIVNFRGTAGGGGSGISGIDFTDGSNVYTSKTELNFNNSQFYLSGDLAGDPVVNINTENLTFTKNQISNFKNDPFYLNDAQDVNAPSASDNEVLEFDSSTRKWTAVQRFTLSDGTDSAPSYSFANDSTSGLFRQASNVLGVSVGGTERFRFRTDSLRSTSLGSAATPIYSFTGATGTGISATSTPGLIISTGGTERVRINAGGATGGVQTAVRIRNVDGSAALPAYSFTSETSLGMLRTGVGSLGLAAGGASRLTLSSTLATFNVTSQIRMNGNDGTAATPAYSFGTGTTGLFRRTSAPAGLGFTVNGVRRGIADVDHFTIDSRLNLKKGVRGFYLNMAEDVNAPSAATGEVLTYNSATGFWEPEAVTDIVDFGFYLTAKHTDGTQSYSGLSVLNFNVDNFYLTQNSPNTDEVIVNFRVDNTNLINSIITSTDLDRQQVYDNSPIAPFEVTNLAAGGAIDFQDASSNSIFSMDNDLQIGVFGTVAPTSPGPDGFGSTVEQWGNGASIASGLVDSVAIGASATITGIGEVVAIGSGASSSSILAPLASNVVIGYNASISGTSHLADSTVVGAEASVGGGTSFQSQIALGARATVTGNQGTAIGTLATVSGTQGFALGFTSNTSANSGISIGAFSSSSATGTGRSIAIGHRAASSGIGSIILASSPTGGSNSVSGTNSVVIGSPVTSPYTVSNNNCLSFWGATTDNNQVLFGGDGGGVSLTNYFFGRGVTSTTDVAPNFNVTGGSGTNDDVHVREFIFNGARGTGTGRGGEIVFRTAREGASGSSLNTLREKFRVTRLGARVQGEFYHDGNLAGFFGKTTIARPNVTSVGAHSQSFGSQVEWTVTHNFNNNDMVWSAYDTGDVAIIPEKVDISDPNTAYFYFTVATAGKAVLISTDLGNLLTALVNLGLINDNT